MTAEVWAPDLPLFKRVASMLLTSVAVIGLTHCGCWLIVDHFRLLRLKEVDIVLGVLTSIVTERTKAVPARCSAF